MIKYVYVYCQAPNPSEKPLDVLNGESIDENEVQRLGLTGKTLPDSSYEVLKDESDVRIYRKCAEDNYCFIIYQNLEQEDDCGRRIAMSSYVESDNDDYKEVYSAINTQLKMYDRSVMVPVISKKKEKHKIIDKFANRVKQLCKSAKILICVICCIIIGIIIVFIHYCDKRNEKCNILEKNTLQMERL